MATTGMKYLSHFKVTSLVFLCIVVLSRLLYIHREYFQLLCYQICCYSIDVRLFIT